MAQIYTRRAWIRRIDLNDVGDAVPETQDYYERHLQEEGRLLRQ